MAILLILFIVVPIVELAVIIQVGSLIGVGPTIALLILDSVLGTLLMRAQGRAAWRRFTEAVQAGRPPAREVIDGGLVLLGGAFLLAPGFITDIVGICLLLPPTRALVRRLLSRRLLGGMTISLMGSRRGGGGSGGRPGDVEGTAVDLDQPQLGPR